MASIDVADAATSSAWGNPFKQKVFMIVNQAIGGNAGGDPSHTTFPLTYEVDYVRVYQGGAPAPKDMAACEAACAARKAQGCCEWHDADGACRWEAGAHVQGGGGSAGKEATNCYASGKCDGWNGAEACSG
jgi:hypothetical protein